MSSQKMRRKLNSFLLREMDKYFRESLKTKQWSRYALTFALGITAGTAGAFFLIDLKHEFDEPRHLPFGWPSKCNILIRQGYVLSYDTRTRNASWVYEHLTRDTLKEAQNVDRSKANFIEDKDFSPQHRVHPNDYLNSGYDRGHLAPARDFKSSQSAMNESFFMTNISPQVGLGFNRSYWSALEGFIRHLTSIYSNVHVITGPLFLPKKDKKSGKSYVHYEVIGDQSNIAVPTHFFKVILAEKKYGEYVIDAFMVPNKAIPDGTPLEKFITPIDIIERFSGLTFFEKLPKHQKRSLCTDTKCQLKMQKFLKFQIDKKEEGKT